MQGHSNALSLILQYNRSKHIKPKVAVYTCISGAYDALITPEALNPEWDYILFTDAKLQGLSHLQLRPLPYKDDDPVRVARFVKINAHIVLPEYDYTLWVDGNILLKNNGFFNYIASLISGKYDICFRQHPDRNCVYEEIKKCQELKKDDFGIMRRQVRRYEILNFPQNAGMFSTGVIFRKNTSDTALFNNIWWKELSNGSRRDQLSVVYALKLSGLTFTLFDQSYDISNADNPWFYIYPHPHVLVHHKKAAKYSQPYFYTLVFNENGAVKKHMIYHKLYCKYSEYKVSYPILKAILPAAINADDKTACENLDEVAKRLPYLKLETVWQKVLYDMLSGNTHKAKAGLCMLEKTESNAVLRFYIALFHQEVFDEVSVELANSIMDNRDRVEFLCSLMRLSCHSDRKITLLNEVFLIYGLGTVRSFSLYKNHATLNDLFPARPVHKHDFNTTEPLVSVIIPTFNAELIIETALYSVISQSWTNIEIIVLDGCSLDNTCHIVRDFMQYDKRITLIEHNKHGLPEVSADMALNICRGKFMTVTTAEDWSHPDKIRLQASHLSANDDILANVACLIRMDTQLTPIRFASPSFKQVNTSSLMIKRSVVEHKVIELAEARFGSDAKCLTRWRTVFGSKVVIALDAVTAIGRIS
jgi:hypothetical protein